MSDGLSGHVIQQLVRATEVVVVGDQVDVFLYLVGYISYTMGDGEPLIVDFDSFSKGMSFYSPEHPQKGLRVPASRQQLDHSHSGAATDTGEQLYSSAELSAAEQMDKLSSKTSLEKTILTDMAETKSELQNGIHGSKENGSSDAGIESLMTSLGQLALAQSGAMNVGRSASWDEQTLSSAMYHLLAQSGSGFVDGDVSVQQRGTGTTAGNMSSHQLALGSVPLVAPAPHSNAEPYPSWNDSSVPMHGSWARHNGHYSGSGLSNQRRAVTYIPSADLSMIVPKLRQNSPFPKSLQHLVATSKANSGCTNTVNSGSSFNLHQVTMILQ